MTNPITDDPRIDPRIKAMFGDFTAPPMPELESREALVAMVQSMTGADGQAVDPSSYEKAVPATELTIRVETLPQPAGHAINLQITTPEGKGPFACVYYIHGGGMMMSSCFDANYAAWGRLIAGFGVVVVQVDFRNALYPSSVPEIAPYPAGLDDCLAGLRWLRDHASALNIDPARIVVQGESGGANLAIATALRLKREGELELISGLYVSCPYLAGDWPGGAGTSADQNAGILMDARSSFGAMAYGIEALRAGDPLAWPGLATEQDVAGFPPTVVVVNECDPLRDDGIAFYRLLIRAGVTARSKQLMGTVHGTEIYILCCPEISRDEARAIASFAVN